MVAKEKFSVVGAIVFLDNFMFLDNLFSVDAVLMRNPKIVIPVKINAEGFIVSCQFNDGKNYVIDNKAKCKENMEIANGTSVTISSKLICEKGFSVSGDGSSLKLVNSSELVVRGDAVVKDAGKIESTDGEMTCEKSLTVSGEKSLIQVQSDVFPGGKLNVKENHVVVMDGGHIVIKDSEMTCEQGLVVSGEKSKLNVVSGPRSFCSFDARLVVKKNRVVVESGGEIHFSSQESSAEDCLSVPEDKIYVYGSGSKVVAVKPVERTLKKLTLNIEEISIGKKLGVIEVCELSQPSGAAVDRSIGQFTTNVNSKSSKCDSSWIKYTLYAIIFSLVIFVPVMVCVCHDAAKGNNNEPENARED